MATSSPNDSTQNMTSIRSRPQLAQYDEWCQFVSCKEGGGCCWEGGGSCWCERKLNSNIEKKAYVRVRTQQPSQRKMIKPRTGTTWSRLDLLCMYVVSSMLFFFLAILLAVRSSLMLSRLRLSRKRDTQKTYKPTRNSPFHKLTTTKTIYAWRISSLKYVSPKPHLSTPECR